MSKLQSSVSTSTRRNVIRAACVVAYFALLAVLFVNGKGHTVLIDNKDSPDGAHPALEFAAVAVNNDESAEYYPGDRDKASVKGQKHRVRIELEDGTIVEKDFAVPLSVDMVLLSVPMMVAGVDGAVIPFTPLDAAPPPDDNAGNVNEFTAPMGPEEPGAETAAPEAPAVVQ